jgi:multiple sugar transport system substrate-binding protein
MKHTVKLLFLTAFLTLAASGLSLAQTVKLQFWGGWTGPDGDVMRQMVDEYNKAHPDVQVTLTTLQWTPLFTKFVAAAAAGNSPDIMAMHGPDIPQFAAKGLLSPLGSVIKDAGFAKDQFATPAWDGTIYQDEQYAFPLDLHMHAVFYNASLFQKAGLTPPGGWITKDDFLKLAKALTVDKNGKHPGDDGFDPKAITQYGLAMYNNHHGFYMWYALLHQQGDNFLNKSDTQVDYPTDAGVAAWQWLQDLVFKYHVVPVGETSPSQDFLIGKTAMLIDGPWQIPAMIKQEGLKWGDFPVPQVFAKKATWGSGHVLTVPARASHKKEAEAFITWIIKHSDEWGKSGNIPALNAARDSETFKALPGRDGFVASLPYEVMLPAIPKEAQVFSAAGTSPIVVASQRILVQDKDIAGALKQMNRGINNLLQAP